MMGMAMPGRDLGPGERIARRNRRRMYAFFAVTALFGGVVGGAIGGLDMGNTHGFAPEAIRLPPLVAVLVAIGSVLALAGVPLYAFRLVDEVKVRRNLQGMTAGCLGVLGGYPAWQALAAGGLVPQPSAFGVFLIAYGVMLVASIALKIRD